MNLYYDPNHTGWYKRADWFLAVDVPRLYEARDLRRSYVIWYENQLLQAARNLLETGMPLEQVTVVLSLSNQQIQWLIDHPS